MIVVCLRTIVIPFLGFCLNWSTFFATILLRPYFVISKKNHFVKDSVYFIIFSLLSGVYGFNNFFIRWTAVTMMAIIANHTNWVPNARWSLRKHLVFFSIHIFFEKFQFISFFYGRNYDSICDTPSMELSIFIFFIISIRSCLTKPIFSGL